MIERFIYTALTEGLAAFTADPVQFERVFGFQMGLEPAEVLKIREYFLSTPPTVIHNYARENSSFPLFAIVLKEEAEPTKFLGDFAEVITLKEANEAYEDPALAGAEVFGSVYQHAFDILIYAKSPAVCVWYYHLAKVIMTRARNYFVECGLSDFSLGGADLMPDPRYMPEHLFGRVLRFGCQRVLEVVFDVNEADRVRLGRGDNSEGRVRHVAGIHVAGGSNTELYETPDDGDLIVPGVEALVTSYEPE